MPVGPDAACLAASATLSAASCALRKNGRSVGDSERWPGTRYGNSACTSYPLERLFHFPSFADALAFTNRVGAIAEDEGHHPALLTEWGQVTVTWWTHKIRGLHRNDFIMAAKTEWRRRPTR